MNENNLSSGFAQVVNLSPTPDGFWITLWDIEKEKRISGDFKDAVNLGELVRYSADTMVKTIEIVPECNFPDQLLDRLPLF